jgi:hypothetical protein
VRAPFDRFTRERTVVGHEQSALDPDRQPEPEEQRDVGAKHPARQHDGRRHEHGSQGGAGEKQRPDQHPKRCRELGFIAGIYRVRAEQTQREDDEKRRRQRARHAMQSC